MWKWHLRLQQGSRSQVSGYGSSFRISSRSKIHFGKQFLMQSPQYLALHLQVLENLVLQCHFLGTWHHKSVSLICNQIWKHFAHILEMSWGYETTTELFTVCRLGLTRAKNLTETDWFVVCNLTIPNLLYIPLDKDCVCNHLKWFHGFWAPICQVSWCCW